MTSFHVKNSSVKSTYLPNEEFSKMFHVREIPPSPQKLAWYNTFFVAT